MDGSGGGGSSSCSSGASSSIADTPIGGLLARTTRVTDLDRVFSSASAESTRDWTMNYPDNVREKVAVLDRIFAGLIVDLNALLKYLRSGSIMEEGFWEPEKAEEMVDDLEKIFCAYDVLVNGEPPSEEKDPDR
jgi:hypothetical protein